MKTIFDISGNAVIKCHVCNSKSDGECGDPFFHEVTNRNNIYFVQGFQNKTHICQLEKQKSKLLDNNNELNRLLTGVFFGNHLSFTVPVEARMDN